jgi:4'-phosphopantetheinyl transferase
MPAAPPLSPNRPRQGRIQGLRGHSGAVVLYAGGPSALKPIASVNTLRFGPVVCRRWPYRRGESAEPRVRAWLGEALGWPESRLRVVRDVYGRPRFDAIDVELGANSREIDVNWSHSGDWLLAAYAVGAQVGVDIEWLRPRPKALALAGRFFAPEETASLAALAEHPAVLERRFTALWCAKEAVLKAHGRGLSFGLDKLRFALNDDAEAQDAPQMVACDPALGAPRDWHLHAWTPGPGYLATVAWRERGLDTERRAATERV